MAEITQVLTLSNGNKVRVHIGSPVSRMEVQDNTGRSVTIPLSITDLEEVTDLLMDSFYKAGLIAHENPLENSVRKEAPHA